MSKPIFCAFDIAFKVTLLPCPYRISNYLLMKETLLGTFFFEERAELLEEKKVIHAFFCIAM
jgi:hypothetical protein